MTRQTPFTRAVKERMGDREWLDEELLIKMGEELIPERVLLRYTKGRKDSLENRRRWYIRRLLERNGARKRVQWQLIGRITSRTMGLTEKVERILGDGAWHSAGAIAAVLPIRPEVAHRQYQNLIKNTGAKPSRSLNVQLERGRRSLAQQYIQRVRAGLEVESRGRGAKLEYRMVLK